MADAEPDRSAVTGDFARSWRIVTAAGVLGMIYYQAAFFGAPRTKFLLELGATPFDFGLIAGLGALTLTFQLISGVFANRLRHRKPVWMVLFLLHRLTFIGVLAAPVLFTAARPRIWWIIGVIFVHNVLVHIGDPIWFSWMTDLVPTTAFNRHWAARQRVITLCTIVSGIVIAVVFNHFEQTDRVIAGFTVLCGFGILLGSIDICMFGWVPEPAHHHEPEISLRAALWEPLRNHEFRPFLVFRAYWTFALMVAAPFFGLYLIREMGFSVLVVQLGWAVHALGLAVASRFWGKLCDLFGYRPVLQLTVAVKFMVPLTYLLVPHVPAIAIPVFAGMFFVDGMLNAAGRLATQGVALRCTPRRNRAMYVAFANFVALGLAGGLAPLIGGALIKPLTALVSTDFGPYHITGFHVVFLLSFVLRLCGLPLVNRLREPESRPVGEVIAHIRSERPFWAWPLR